MTKFALIGCGRIGERHAVQIRRIGKLAAVCDTDILKANRLAEGASVYTHIDDLLQAEKDLEVVVVCTPNGLHAEHVIKSLQSRKHVLCEKPLCIASSAAWSMRDTAHFFRRHLFVVKQARFNPPVLKAKALLESGSLGAVLSFSVQGFWSRSQAYYDGGWHGTKAFDGGILYTQFSHFIDLLLWLLGDVAEVTAITKNAGLRSHFEIADTVAALLQMQNGAVGTAHFSVNAFGENKEGSLSMLCEKGSVKIGGQYLNTFEWAGAIEKGAQGTTADNVNHGLHTGSTSNHHLVYDELQKALSGKAHTLPHINEAVNAVRVIEKIYTVADSI